MTKKKRTGAGVTFTSFMLFAILGYFVYGGIDGALGMILSDMLLSLTALLGFIPVVGVVLYWVTANNIVMPAIFNLTGLHSTWLTTILVYFGLAVSILATLISSFFIWLAVALKR